MGVDKINEELQEPFKVLPPIPQYILDRIARSGDKICLAEINGVEVYVKKFRYKGEKKDIYDLLYNPLTRESDLKIYNQSRVNIIREVAFHEIPLLEPLSFGNVLAEERRAMQGSVGQNNTGSRNNEDSKSEIIRHIENAKCTSVGPEDKWCRRINDLYERPNGHDPLLTSKKYRYYRIFFSAVEDTSLDAILNSKLYVLLAEANPSEYKRQSLEDIGEDDILVANVDDVNEGLYCMSSKDEFQALKIYKIGKRYYVVQRPLVSNDMRATPHYTYPFLMRHSVTEFKKQLKQIVDENGEALIVMTFTDSDGSNKREVKLKANSKTDIHFTPLGYCLMDKGVSRKHYENGKEYIYTFGDDSPSMNEYPEVNGFLTKVRVERVK